MKFKKLKNIIISTVTVVALFSSNIYYASALELNDKNGNVSENEGNVLNVNVDDNGSVSYNLNDADKPSEDNQFSWDDASVYFAMTDRFSNGDTSNDHSYGRSVNEADADNYQNRQGTFHGGDLKGLTNKVSDGYFDKLGVNAIWITAPYEQMHGAVCGDGFKHYAYHGYYTLDYTNVDGNMGTAEDLENFIDTAHSHGIRVVFDVVMNHAGYADPVTANEYGFGALASDWKDIYYKWNEKDYKYWNDYVQEAADHNTKGIMIRDADWITNWWSPDWIRARGDRFKGYTGYENGPDEKTMCLNGLPDFKTENQNPVSLPGLLKTKWQREGRLDKETKELDDFFNSTGKSRTVSNYLVKWLTDWVREYGVDGFRCDTAKHIDVSCWKDLKDEAKKALKEWRANNPDKPGAKWKDDFWMTGEHFDHGVYKDNYFNSGAFDSMINFKFKEENRVFKSSSEIDETFSSYANSINSDDSFNVLSYISSHDKGLSRGNMITAGNNLLLLPGGVQIFYGDETNRQAVGSNEEQSYRSEMNWNSEDTNELQHWQKLGQFRNRHIAVGAGTHKKISSSPYTFSREYNKNGVSDKVVVALTDTAGNKTISVDKVFNDEDVLRDFYTGKEYKVENNSVNVEAGTNGVVLLELVKEEPSVGLTASQEYYTEPLTVTLKCTEGVSAKYSIDGSDYKSYTNGQTIEIKDKVIGDETKVKVIGTDANGNEVKSKEAVYTKAIIPEGITLHVKNTSWTEAPNVYAYNDENGVVEKYTGEWPGTKMTDEGNGWYTISLKGKLSGKVIFNGSWGQYPASKQPGIDVKAGRTWILNNEIIPEPEDGTVNVKYVDKATGKEIADSTTINGIVGQNYTTSAKSIKGYKVSETPSNATGTVSKDAITVTYQYEVSEGLTVHVKNSKFNGTPNIYVYSEENGKVTQYTGAWPGVKMTDEGNGWYSYTNSDVESAKVIYNGSWGQYPACNMPGMDVNGEVWILDNMFVNQDLAK